MPGSNNIRIRFHLGRGTWWSILLGLVLALAIGIAVAIVAASIFIILVPIMVAAAAVFYLLGRAKLRRARPGPAKGTSILDEDFRVIGPDELAPKSSGDHQAQSRSPR